MSYYTAEQNQRWSDDDQPRKATRKPPANTDQALRTLASSSATDADKLRAWLRIGIDLGLVEIRDAARVGVVTR